MNSQTIVTLSDAAASSTSADALVVAASQGAKGAVLLEGHRLGKNAVTSVQRHLGEVGAEGAADEIVKVPSVPGVKAPVVVVVGAGRPGSVARSEQLRRAAGAAGRALAGKTSAVLALGADGPEEVAAVAEGVSLGGYSFQTFYGASKSDGAVAPLAEAIVVGVKARSKDGRAVQARVSAITSAVTYARDLVNTPPNVLFPESFAETVGSHAKGTGVRVDVWDVDRLEAEGCGGILGVGLGSARTPRLVVLDYRPKHAAAHLAFVGKGITFDSGGLCLKPAGSMVTMKCDMAGAAAVAAAVLALAEMKVPVAVTGYLCLAENMTGDLAQRPGDVVTMRGGKTVEVINTDAEGRLVMADGLALASESRPDAIIDIATLTGAAVVALGERTFGVMGNDEALRTRTHETAAAVGEASWPLPMPEEIRASIDSPVADVKHTGERSAGAMVAATFLREFIGDGADGASIPWVHVDIAGPAFNDKPAWGYTTQGGTGAGVRTLIGLAETFAG